ncbi:MAG: SRPBCC family protein [Rhodobacteraceae bacterium]|nr:SRPBCC family protein [Paracoccaceae bacterium]
MTDLDLRLHRILKAPRRAVWRCWTEPDLLRPWFVPKPHRVLEAILDPRPGGRFFTLMEVEGREYPNDGSFLEVVPETRLVFSDVLLADWRPASPPGLGFSAILTLADHPEGTEYTALARHGNAATARRHAEMGFHEGWGTVATQLEAFARTLAP